MKHHKLNIIEPVKQDPSNFYHHFLYKALIITIFIIILPFFPSQAPEFINQSLLTRNWELLHLLFVGIAISYGLFCHRNHGPEKENNNNNSKFDTAQSYVSKFLQVSSFFEDDSISETPHDDDKGKNMTWNNYYEYHRNEPVVVVTPKRTNNVRISEKPLLLPVRSLKSKVSDPCQFQCVNESNPTSVSVIGSKDNKVVHASPVRWRSESLMKLQNSKLPRSNSMSSSTSLASLKKKEQYLSSESVAENSEDRVKNKSFHKTSSIPLPPPPPPPMVFKSISMKPKSSTLLNHVDSSVKDIKRSFSTTESKEKVMMGFDDDTESEDEGGGGGGIVKDKVENEANDDEEKSKAEGGIGEEGPDVDKKADEFIARFREQIRLQRIDSIKRSANRMARNSSR